MEFFLELLSPDGAFINRQTKNNRRDEETDKHYRLACESYDSKSRWERIPRPRPNCGKKLLIYCGIDCL